MDKRLLSKAKILAKSGYSITIQVEQTSNGENLFFAQCQELDGCMAQGKTPEEAIENIYIAIEDFIYFLLEDKMPIPEPSCFQTMDVASSVSKEVNVFEENSLFVTKYVNKRIERLKNIETKKFRDPHSSLLISCEV